MTTEDRFISPTMQWAYDKYPEWFSRSSPHLYQMGFSQSGAYDIKGYDRFGFNEIGVDRLGCSETDYEDYTIYQIARMAEDRFSLSNKLSTPLPHLLKLRPGFERICREQFDGVADSWKFGNSLEDDDEKHLIFLLGPEFTMMLSWWDAQDEVRRYIAIQSDAIASFDAPADGFGVLVTTNMHLHSDDDIEGMGLPLIMRVCANSADEMLSRLSEILDIEETHSYTFYIEDTPKGPQLVALTKNEIKEVHEGVLMDHILSPIIASSRHSALQQAVCNSKTATVKIMAERGIEALDNAAQERRCGASSPHLRF